MQNKWTKPQTKHLQNSSKYVISIIFPKMLKTSHQTAEDTDFGKGVTLFQIFTWEKFME